MSVGKAVKVITEFFNSDSVVANNTGKHRDHS